MKQLVIGKCEFANHIQTFVDVMKSTSIVKYTLRNTAQRGGGTLVTTDGLEIEDSSGTQDECSDYLHYRSPFIVMSNYCLAKSICPFNIA